VASPCEVEMNCLQPQSAKLDKSFSLIKPKQQTLQNTVRIYAFPVTLFLFSDLKDANASVIAVKVERGVWMTRGIHRAGVYSGCSGLFARYLPIPMIEERFADFVTAWSPIVHRE
jgi:hypothetical protein